MCALGEKLVFHDFLEKGALKGICCFVTHILGLSHNDFHLLLLIKVKVLWKNQGLYDNFRTILG